MAIVFTQPRAHAAQTSLEPIVLTVAGTESTAATLITPAADEVEIAADLLSNNSAIFRTKSYQLVGRRLPLEVGLSGDQDPVLRAS